MSYKLTGAALIITSCSAYGIALAIRYRQRDALYAGLISILQYMENELQFRLTPLPELCRNCTSAVDGCLKRFFLDLARELDWNTAPDAASCMKDVLCKYRNLPPDIIQILLRLGNTLGIFDLTGQLKEFQAVREGCAESLRVLRRDKEIRIRNYQTLGFCTGTALAVLLA